MTLWRNGNALDSRPKDWEFDSLQSQIFKIISLRKLGLIIPEEKHGLWGIGGGGRGEEGEGGEGKGQESYPQTTNLIWNGEGILPLPLPYRRRLWGQTIGLRQKGLGENRTPDLLHPKQESYPQTTNPIFIEGLKDHRNKELYPQPLTRYLEKGEGAPKSRNHTPRPLTRYLEKGEGAPKTRNHTPRPLTRYLERG